MKVIVADKCGFCHGVKNAINIAEETLQQKENVYSLGAVIHNKDVVDKLAESGLKTIERVEEIASGTVLIRSHGATPEQLTKLKAKGLDIVDATCVLVKRLQQTAARLNEDGYTVVIIGDRNHPEVKAVKACAQDAIVIGDESDMQKLPADGKLGIVCQTTQTPENFIKVLTSIAQAGFSEMKVINTLCREALKRQQSAVEVCKQVDIMFVLGGLESANTRKLAELCKKYNKQTFHLQNYSELDRILLSGKRTAGVTAGASTPQWVIEEFVSNLEKQPCL